MVTELYYKNYIALKMFIIIISILYFLIFNDIIFPHIQLYYILYLIYLF